MPAPAILAAAAAALRAVGAAAAGVARVAISATVRGVARLASASAVAMRRAGVAFYRGARSAVSALRRSGRSFVASLGRTLMKFKRQLFRLRSSMIKMMREIVEDVFNNYQDVMEYLERAQARRRASRYFADKVYRDALESDIAYARAMEALAGQEAPPDEDYDRREVWKAAMMAMARQRMRNIVHSFEQGYLTAQQALADFAEHVAPTLLAARVGATDAVESLDDVDAQEEMRETTAAFAALLHNFAAGDMTLQQYTAQLDELMDDFERAAARAAFRYNLAAAVLRMSASEVVDEAAIAERMSSVDSDDITELLAATSDYAHGELSIYDYLGILTKKAALIYASDVEIGEIVSDMARRLINRAYAESRITLSEKRQFLRALPRRKGESAVKENSGIDRVEDVMPDEPDQVLQELTKEGEPETTPAIDAEENPEDGVIYGLWVLSCNREVEEHCAECESLSALTHSHRIPIHDLPIPGTTTPCMERCACCVEPVDASEYFDQVTEYWTSFAASKGIHVSQVLDTLSSDPAGLARSVNNTKRYAAAVSKWYQQLLGKGAQEVEGED